MSGYLEGDGASAEAVSVYDADPVLRLSGIAPPDPPAEPMDAREREYFVRVGDALFARRTKVREGSREAWSALRAEFLTDSPFRENPPSAKKTMEEIEALALIVRVSCCRCGHPIWVGYHAELRLALFHHLGPKARAQGILDWENCVADLMVALFDARLGEKHILNLEDPAESRRIVEEGTPKFWRYNPSYYFSSWLNRVAVNFMIDVGKKAANRPSRNLPLGDDQMRAIPAGDHVEGEVIGRASENPERDRLLSELARGLNSMGLHPKFIEANIRALIRRRQQELAAAESPGDADRIRARTQAKLFVLNELNAGWREHEEVIRSANAHIDSELGRAYAVKTYCERKLYWRCADLFILHCLEACGADVSLLGAYMRRRQDDEYPMDRDVRQRMKPFLRLMTP